jgi:hypothetical protein
MSRPELDAVVIGFKNRAEIVKAIRRINGASGVRGASHFL